MQTYETVPALAGHIAARMRQLSLGPAELAERAGVSQAGLRHLRRGHRKDYQPRFTGPVCRALGWTPDSIERILAGGEPVLDGEPAVDRDPTLREVRDLLRETRDDVARLTALVDDATGTSTAALAALAEQVRRLAGSPSAASRPRSRSR